MKPINEITYIEELSKSERDFLINGSNFEIVVSFSISNRIYSELLDIIHIISYKNKLYDVSESFYNSDFLSKLINTIHKKQKENSMKVVNLDDLLWFLLHYPNLMYNTPTYKEIREIISESDIDIILKGGARRLYTATCSKTLEWHEEEYKRCFSVESMSGF